MGKGVKTRISVEDRGSAKLKRSAQDVTKLQRRMVEQEITRKGRDHGY